MVSGMQKKNSGFIGESKFKSIFNRILPEIRPTEEEIEELNAYSNDLMGRLKRIVPKDVEIILAGSVARGTQIRGNSDIDIFLLFPKTTEERLMEKKALLLARKVVKKGNGETFVINYAEHPYLKLISKKLDISADIVPAFKINDAADMGTAVDRTQLHNVFVKNHLNEKQKDEVRLLKYFLRANSIYGAESRIEGFSGYLCELLICHYGSFLELIKSFSELELPLVLDILKSKQINNREEISKDVNFFKSEFIVIDPTDKERNVAASVSRESISRLVIASRRLLDKPSVNNFYGIKYSDENSRSSLSKMLQQYEIDIYAIGIEVPEISEDTLWPQIKRLKGKFSDSLKRNGFEPLLELQNLTNGRAAIAFLMNKKEIHANVIKGPSVFMKNGSYAFYKKHENGQNMFLDGDILCSIEKSKYESAGALLKSAFKDHGFSFPPDIRKRNCKIFINRIPEEYAKLVYPALLQKIGI